MKQTDAESAQRGMEPACLYDPELMQLTRDEKTAQLGSNESDFLLALIDGVSDKELLISRVWGERGLVVSDGSYYKTLHTLRTHFSVIGLSRHAIKTLPRRGVLLLCTVTLSSQREPHDDSVQTEPGAENTPIQYPAESGAPTLLPEPSSAQAVVIPAPAPSPVPAPQPRNYFRIIAGYAVVLGGLVMPVVYAWLMLCGPPELEGWKAIWSENGHTLYVESSEKLSRDDIAEHMKPFDPNLLFSGTSYYVRKPLSQLVISCEKPESKGEAICTNYQNVGKKP